MTILIYLLSKAFLYYISFGDKVTDSCNKKLNRLFRDTLAILVTSIVRYVSAPELITGTVIGSTLGEILDAVIQVFAWLTAIFALVERFAADTIAKEWKKDDWDPVDLPDVPIKEAAFKRSEPIVSIIFIFIFLIF